MSTSAQTPDEVLMVRPRLFGFDAETAASNAFQEATAARSDSNVLARAEFDAAVTELRSNGVRVKVFEEAEDGVKRPDSVFPNNWFSTHCDGSVFLYPMLSTSRRKERRMDIVQYFKETRKVVGIYDLSVNESDGVFLEGTGSVVFDHVTRTGYACKSPRTDEDLFRRICHKLHYSPVLFTATDASGMLIYHTNVMMWIGSRAAGVCLDSIRDNQERALVFNSLRNCPGRAQVFDLTQDEVLGFAGNCFEVGNDKGEKFLVMSKRAESALDKAKLSSIRSCFTDVIVCNVDHIEAVGGGGIRCMIAGIHLKGKQQN